GGVGPAFVAVTPDATGAVVSDNSGNTLKALSICMNGSTTVIPGNAVATGHGPNGVAIAPTPLSVTGSSTKWLAYVVDSADNDVRRYVLTVDPAQCTASLSDTPTKTTTPSIVPVGTSPYGIAITPDGSKAYVTNSGAGTVTPIDLATGTAGAP